ncbi:hypothetical protein Spla01_01324 [Streptomyces platensis]|uniref:Uncharacterized protein n=1 Tax=Streptomyces platensis TaxID=58346 RepID=A0ABX3Y5C2_STRPT|nr:hypothetical protein [Streptomyces platensis]OSY48107.1 hypothetical protein BG653_00741 [Streptomyces platensis]BCK67468.1 hypothetical protein Srufu_014210 [Streptomyces libani subsp. rufus]
MAPLEPFAVYDANELPQDRFTAAKQEYGQRLDGLFTEEPSTSARAAERPGNLAGS